MSLANVPHVSDVTSMLELLRGLGAEVGPLRNGRLSLSTADVLSSETTYDIVDNLRSSADELRLTLRPDAQALGLTLADVTRQVGQAFYGYEVQRLPRDGRAILDGRALHHVAPARRAACIPEHGIDETRIQAGDVLGQRTDLVADALLVGLCVGGVGLGVVGIGFGKRRLDRADKGHIRAHVMPGILIE